MGNGKAALLGERRGRGSVSRKAEGAARLGERGAGARSRRSPRSLDCQGRRVCAQAARAASAPRRRARGLPCSVP